MRRFRPIAILVVCWIALVAHGSEAQSSATYSIDRLTIASSASPSSSTNYAIDVTLAQQGPVGAASRCNDSWLQSLGYWSLFGEMPVPVFLSVDKDSLDPTSPELSWTGSSSEFTVYRSTMVPGVLDPVNELLVTTACDAVDTPPPAAVTFYLIQPTGN